MMDTVVQKSQSHAYRKWIGVLWLLLESNLMSANIYGFSAIFKVLPKYGISEHYCQSSNATNGVELNCQSQIKQYQKALTLGIIFFNVPSMFVGIVIDIYGCRSIKLFGMLLHIFGWLAMALLEPGRDYLLYIHTLFISLSGIMVQITGYASSSYFSKYRALLSTLFVGASLSSSIWYSVFQKLIDDDHLTLTQLSYIWMSIGFLMLPSSFLFLDWKLPLLNLPYSFDTQLEQIGTISAESQGNKHWFRRILQREGLWEHLTNPLYIVLVLFASILIMPNNLLSVTWYPWVYFITNNNKVLSDEYTFAFNLSSLSAIVLCPISGFLLTFKADRDPKRKLLNISIVQTYSWIWGIICCIVYMFVQSSVIIPALILNCILRSTIVAGSQAVLSTFFPSQYIGRLTGITWTAVGAITCIQYGLVQLTEDVTRAWRAWAIVLVLILCMSCHVIQIWTIYFRKRRELFLRRVGF